jgi:hypothetical protein
MIKYAFAISTCGQHFKVAYSTNKEQLFEKAKKYMLIKSWFDKYLQQALESPERFISLKDPQADAYPEEYFEMILGESKAVKAYIKAQNL